MRRESTRRQWLASVAAFMTCPALSARAGDGRAYWAARLHHWLTSAGRSLRFEAEADRELTVHLRRLRGLEPLDRIYLAQRLVNSLPFHGEPIGSDDWRLPAVTWRDGGDCEDLALLKLALLSLTSAPNLEGRLVVADIPFWGLHAFATVRAGGRWWRLDSLAEATDWDGGPLPYPGPDFRRLWMSAAVTLEQDPITATRNS